ncbi:hypothetical protein DSL72_004606 [Monilinia vaccinii-corymbosi]|uniref:RanBP2-type domain-containing protein n=1 Tax=Monilinia vaccinii-corymbosi TaxID=61207 RepID=A0A8A3P481_9HELO|nr:hypothetical protein DSL72_004606 [Monilinia vaccinii-corymbosi]
MQRAFPFPVNLGTDICQISRINDILTKHQSKYAHRFIRRVFTPQEQVWYRPRLLPLIEYLYFMERREFIQEKIEKQQRWRAKSIEALIGLVGPKETPLLNGTSANREPVGSLIWSPYTTQQDPKRLSKGEEESMLIQLQQNVRGVARFIAGRFAAKEAAKKAFSKRRLGFHDIIIDNPSLDDLRSRAPITLVKSTNGQEDQIVPMSISHDGDYATAVCMSCEGLAPPPMPDLQEIGPMLGHLLDEIAVKRLSLNASSIPSRDSYRRVSRDSTVEDSPTENSAERFSTPLQKVPVKFMTSVTGRLSEILNSTPGGASSIPTAQIKNSLNVSDVPEASEPVQPEISSFPINDPAIKNNPDALRVSKPVQPEVSPSSPTGPTIRYHMSTASAFNSINVDLLNKSYNRNSPGFRPRDYSFSGSQATGNGNPQVDYQIKRYSSIGSPYNNASILQSNDRAISQATSNIPTSNPSTDDLPIGNLPIANPLIENPLIENSSICNPSISNPPTDFKIKYFMVASTEDRLRTDSPNGFQIKYHMVASNEDPPTSNSPTDFQLQYRMVDMKSQSNDAPLPEPVDWICASKGCGFQNSSKLLKCVNCGNSRLDGWLVYIDQDNKHNRILAESANYTGLPFKIDPVKEKEKEARIASRKAKLQYREQSIYGLPPYLDPKVIKKNSENALVVRNLPPGTTNEELVEAFKGKSASLKVSVQQSPMGDQTAWVIFSRKNEANQVRNLAKKSHLGPMIRGRLLRMTEAENWLREFLREYGSCKRRWDWRADFWATDLFHVYDKEECEKHARQVAEKQAEKLEEEDRLRLAKLERSRLNQEKQQARRERSKERKLAEEMAAQSKKEEKMQAAEAGGSEEGGNASKLAEEMAAQSKKEGKKQAAKAGGSKERGKARKRPQKPRPGGI